MRYRFTVSGPPVGYYTQGKVPNWTRMQKYRSYKALVQIAAMAAGVPNGVLVATKDAPLLIHTKAYFAKGVHPDPENVRKGISDALFYRPKGQGKGSADKYTGGSFAPPLYDAENPRVEVIVESV